MSHNYKFTVHNLHYTVTLTPNRIYAYQTNATQSTRLYSAAINPAAYDLILDLVDKGVKNNIMFQDEYILLWRFAATKKFPGATFRLAGIQDNISKL